MNPEYFGSRAREYDHGMEVLFRTFGVDEAAVREQMVGLLRLASGSRVLETSCGTGRDTLLLASHAGRLWATDVSPEMVDICRARLQAAAVPADRVRLLVADATALPYAAGSFDAAYHFGGINEFADVHRGLLEMVRVVRPGGRVVFGDEGLAPWLLDTEYGRILLNTKPLYRHQPPLHLLPPSARDVACRWVIGGAFYVVDFTVGEGEPFLDIDIEFPGWRGGSHRTRYYGKLDGVSPELRRQVIERAAAEGLSTTAWLEKTLTEKLSGR